MSATSSERVIRRLYEITNAYEQGFDNQIAELLRMGLERFNLDIGIFSKIEDNTYTVMQCVTPDGVTMNPGDQFEFPLTYCHITCMADAPVALEHIGRHDKLGTHPAYQAFGLESYIGVPIRPNGKTYGTLNFSSPTPYPRKFEDIDIDALQLMASWIEVELIRREQEAQLNRVNQALAQLADRDSLTNLLNRRGMFKNLQQEFNRLIRHHGRAVIAMIDIDHFKKLNDTYGHQVGDDALVAVAEKISDAIRDYDFVSRFGGEEFLLLLSEATPEEAAKVCERIMEGIASIDVSPEPITVSIGVCQYEFADCKSIDFEELIDSLIAEADSALYQAKRLGRNRIVDCNELMKAS